MGRRQIMSAMRRGESAYAVERVSDQYGTTTYELWNPTAASGGLFLQEYSAPGQDVDSTVCYFDTARSAAQDGGGLASHVAFRLAIERLTIARDRAYQAAE
jgi:hypothetical protein